MKISLAVAFLMLGSASACWAQSAVKQACNVEVDVTDTDPKGTNVRATPGGAIIATLKDTSDDGWILVHVTAQSGDWFEIDRASLIGVDQPTDGKLLFQGTGYLHRSVLGLSGMQNGGFIYLEHNLKSGLLDGHADGDQPVDLLGCWGDFLKIHVKKGIGWTRQACTNMNTTCA